MVMDVQHVVVLTNLQPKSLSKKANETHNEFYNYSKCNCINNHEKVIIICPVHGDFEQQPNNHLNGQGCPECIKITTENFIEKAIEIHGNKYDYSKSIYTKTQNEIKIICNLHGDFLQTPHHHLLGHGCKKCATETSAADRTLTFEEFESRAKEKHKNFYSYLKATYVDTQTKTSIICPKHGVFQQLPSNHINKGRGCQKCQFENSKLTIEEFIEKAKKKHRNKFDYSKSVYIDCFTPVEIICPKHGLFTQAPAYHLSGKGCQKCKESRGERAIRFYLEDKMIKFESQRNYEPFKKRFVFDFIIEQNGAIKFVEFNGIQHYCPVDFGSTQINADYKNLFSNMKRDYLKYKTCKENGKEIIFIPFWDFTNVNQIMHNFLNDNDFKFSAMPNEVTLFKKHRQMIADKIGIDRGFFVALGIE